MNRSLKLVVTLSLCLSGVVIFSGSIMPDGSISDLTDPEAGSDGFAKQLKTLRDDLDDQFILRRETSSADWKPCNENGGGSKPYSDASAEVYIKILKTDFKARPVFTASLRGSTADTRRVFVSCYDGPADKKHWVFCVHLSLRHKFHWQDEGNHGHDSLRKTFGFDEFTFPDSQTPKLWAIATDHAALKSAPKQKLDWRVSWIAVGERQVKSQTLAKSN